MSLRSHCSLFLATLLITFGTMSSSVKASPIGLPYGHANTPRQFKELTLDIAAHAAPDNVNTGMRLVLPQLAEHYVLFFETSLTSGQYTRLAINGDIDYFGKNFGVGLIYTGLPDWKIFSTTLKIATYWEETESDTALSVSGRSGMLEGERKSQALSVQFSPRKPLAANGLNGYISFGLSYDQQDRLLLRDGVEEPAFSTRDSRFNGTLEAGIVYPIARFHLYAGANYQKEFSVAAGLRYDLSRYQRMP